MFGNYTFFPYQSSHSFLSGVWQTSDAFSLYFLFFLVPQTHNVLIIIVVLLFQAGGSDKKASQGHEEKHRGWFRYVTTGCAIDLYSFTNILDVVWQVFQGLNSICFPGWCRGDLKSYAGICLNLIGFWLFWVFFCLLCFVSYIYIYILLFVCFCFVFPLPFICSFVFWSYVFGKQQ